MKLTFTFFNKFLKNAFLSLFFLFGISGDFYGQLSVSTNFANNNGSGVVIFTFYNGNPYPIDINSIGTFAGTTGVQIAEFWTKSVTGLGQASGAAVNATNGWTLQASQSINTTATVGATAPLILSGMAVAIPANSYYLFCVSLSSIRYSTLGTQTGTFTSNGCDINCTAGNGFGGTLTSPSNTPRGFIGVINFSPGFIPTALDLGVSSFLKPLGTKKCYETDTIVIRLKNFGTSTADFAVDATTLTANTTGPNAGTYSLSLTSGTLASGATQDFTLSTNYNLTNIGTYKLKGYATVIGDGSALNDTTSISLAKSPMFSTSVFPNDSICLGVPVQLSSNFSSTKQLGTGVIENTPTSYPAPYGNYWEGAKHQFLFLASELSVAGLTAGNINSIAFNVTNLNLSDPYTNFNVAIATTTLTNITAFQPATGFTTYFSSPSYMPVLGTNTHMFSTPYVWDGVSNIIIETCFDNTATGFSENVSVSQSTTLFTSTVWYNDDADPTLCNTAVAFNSIMQRPNISFEQPSTITYSWSPSIELSANNIANPMANVTNSRTYKVEGIVAGCMTYDTIRIHIKPTPTPNLGNDSLFCNLPIILNANTIANSYLWDNNSIGSSLNVTASGKYWIRATNTNGCTNSDTILVVAGVSPIVALGPDTAFCQGSTINLYVSNGPGNSYLWNTNSTSTSITVGTTGTYSIIATHTSGCQSSDIINVTSKAKPNVSLVFSGQKMFCPTDGNGRLLSEGSPSGGTYIGSGVTGSSFFPNQAGQGTHILFYNYTASNGCSNIAKDTLFVNACVGIEELNENIGLSVYPNPNSGIFTLELNTNSDINGKISITSIDSKLVFTDIVSGNGLITKSINIADLANGIYYLKVETSDAVKTYKILKQ